MTINLQRRIDALRQMTEANGCTKAEAATAARLAARLAARHRRDLPPLNPFAIYVASMAGLYAIIFALCGTRRTSA
jgi:Protein of unknown function (DUF2786)